MILSAGFPRARTASSARKILDAALDFSNTRVAPQQIIFFMRRSSSMSHGQFTALDRHLGSTVNAVRNSPSSPAPASKPRRTLNATSF